MIQMKRTRLHYMDLKSIFNEFKLQMTPNLLELTISDKICCQVIKVHVHQVHRIVKQPISHNIGFGIAHIKVPILKLDLNFIANNKSFRKYLLRIVKIQFMQNFSHQKDLKSSTECQ